MRFESATAPSSSVQPNSALWRPMTQPATSGASWPGFAIGLVGVALGPRPGNPPNPPRPPAGGAYLIGASPSTQLIAVLMVAACFSQSAADFTPKSTALCAGGIPFSPLS